LQINHYQTVARLILSKIDILDDITQPSNHAVDLLDQDPNSELEFSPSVNDLNLSCNLIAKITEGYSDLQKLQSPEPSCSFSHFEASQAVDNTAFSSFRKGLVDFLRLFLPANGIPFPDTGPLEAQNFRIKPKHQVLVFICVNFIHNAHCCSIADRMEDTRSLVSVFGQMGNKGRPIMMQSPVSRQIMS
jgi:hypothetical protein